MTVGIVYARVFPNAVLGTQRGTAERVLETLVYLFTFTMDIKASMLMTECDD